ncbi:MAG TPA: hypothetical protein VMW67_05175 [Desulfobacteria bacterium]|nr:hypothetical protein [Desulfobacteria bacterium]
MDEALQYPYRDKVIDFVLNPASTDEDLRLLLIGRSGFKELIMRDLREKGVKNVESTELKTSPLFEFLRENFSEIDEDKAREIVESSRNNFVDAMVTAEYFLKKGEVGSSLDVLGERVEKYIEDIVYNTGKTKKDVREIIDVLSLITPLKWEDDKEHLKKALFPRQYEVLANIIQEVSTASTDILVMSERDYVFKFDRFADYLKSEFIPKENFNRFWLPRLLRYMPLRISFNIFVLPRFKKGVAQKTLEILNEIWGELNSSLGLTQEYFSALVLFTGNLSSYPFFEIEKADISKWVESYTRFSQDHPESVMKEVREELAKGLFNATDCYGEAKQWPELEACLEELRNLYTDHPEKEVREELAKGLFNARNCYGEAKQWPELEACLKELRQLHTDFPEKEVREELAKGLFNATRVTLDQGKDCFDDLILLHKLRFDLPDD